MPVVRIATVNSVCCYFNLHPLDYDRDRAVLKPRIYGSVFLEAGAYFISPGRRCNIPVLWSILQQTVSYTASHNICLKTVVIQNIQCCSNFSRNNYIHFMSHFYYLLYLYPLICIHPHVCYGKCLIKTYDIFIVNFAYTIAEPDLRVIGS